MEISSEFSLFFKILLIALVMIFTYLLSLLILTQLYARPVTVHDMMMRYMMGYYDTSSLVINIASLLAALFAGIMAVYFIGIRSREKEEKAANLPLSEDEKRVLDEIKKAGEITQDSLRFRLGWSKAKLSRILTILDKRNLIQRERIGKTYNIFIPNRRRTKSEEVD